MTAERQTLTHFRKRQKDQCGVQQACQPYFSLWEDHGVHPLAAHFWA